MSALLETKERASNPQLLQKIPKVIFLKEGRMCRDLFVFAASKLRCPIKLWPKCHPKAHLDVYVDAAKREILLCCSQCDRPVRRIVPRFKKKIKPNRPKN